MTPPALDWRSVERKLTRMRLLIEQLATRQAPEQFGEYIRQASRWFAERSGAV